jgi:hypothetical protein
MTLNLDKKNQTKAEKNKKLLDAFKSGDEQLVADAMTQFAEGIQQEIIQEAQAQQSDNQVLAGRGARILTTTERKFYNEVVAAEGFDGVETLLPPTIFTAVFDNLVLQHPLLAAIDFVNTTALSKWILKKGDVHTAFWGKLTSDIQKLIDDGFETFDATLYKLSAYLPVAKAMLDLGPEWLDRYVRTVLEESMALALEDAIVAGDGNGKPIGMIKDLNGAVTGGVYPDKTVTASITDLKPVTFGTEIMEPLTHVHNQDGTDTKRRRVVPGVTLIVNPSDYWTKIFPATTTLLTLSGDYKSGILPLPATVIQSVSVPAGKMIAGVASDYFLGVGSTRQIVRATEVHIIEDEDVYLTKQYANGRPKNNNGFLIFDISGLQPLETTEVPTP